MYPNRQGTHKASVPAAEALTENSAKAAKTKETVFLFVDGSADTTTTVTAWDATNKSVRDDPAKKQMQNLDLANSKGNAFIGQYIAEITEVFDFFVANANLSRLGRKMATTYTPDDSLDRRKKDTGKQYIDQANDNVARLKQKNDDEIRRVLGLSSIPRLPSGCSTL